MSSTTVNICRTCLSTDGELISLFSDISETAHLTNKIMNISDITINKNDGLPYMICKKCVFLIESFDCFKKQIESANVRVKDFWLTCNRESQVGEAKLTRKIEHFIGEEKEEYDESEYEIQYISEEVKRDVENAFRKKRQKELAKICMNLKNYGDVILIPIQDIIEEKKTQSDWNTAEVHVEADKVCFEEDKIIEPNVTSGRSFEFNDNFHLNAPQVIDSTKVDNFYNDEADTIQSANSDCNERLTIEIEETDDPSEKLLEPEYVELGEKFESAQGREIEEKDVSPSNDRKETLEETEISRQKCLDPLDLGDNDDKKNLVQSAVRDSTERENNKVLPTPTHKAEKNVVESREIDNIRSDLPKAGQPDIRNEQFTAENCHKRTEAVAATGEPLRIVVEATGTEKSLDSENKIVRNEKLNTNDEGRFVIDDQMRSDVSRFKDPNGDKMEIENESEEMENIGKKCLRLDNGETGIARCEKSSIAEKTKNIERKIPNIKELTCQEKNALRMQKGLVENGISVKFPRNDSVIVISSDTSDEERRKNYLKTAKQSASSLPRRARKKLFQSREALKKNHIPQSQDRKIAGEAEKEQSEPKIFKPKKYFQCTNCNINLYSVSAVLYHHNQTHTPPHESLSCQMCDVRFPTKIDLHAHFDQHVESHLYRCNFCTCEFVLKKNLQTHTNAHMRPKIAEPNNKRLKLEEPSGNTQLPVEENVGEAKKKPVVDE